jgi:asparagine synthetase A
VKTLSFKNGTKLKSESKCGEKFLKKTIVEIWRLLSEKNGNIVTEYTLIIILFENFGFECTKRLYHTTTQR